MKLLRGGLVDIDFIAQYLLLRHGPETPGLAPGSAYEICRQLAAHGCIEHGFAAALQDADQFLGEIFNRLRLCCDRDFDEESALPGLKKLLCDAAGMDDFGALKARLIDVERDVMGYYNSVFQP